MRDADFEILVIFLSGLPNAVQQQVVIVTGQKGFSDVFLEILPVSYFVRSGTIPRQCRSTQQVAYSAHLLVISHVLRANIRSTTSKHWFMSSLGALENRNFHEGTGFLPRRAR